MATPAATLAILVEANTGAANANLAKTDAALRGTAAAGGRTTTSTSKASSALKKMGTVAKWGGAALTAGFVVAAKKSVETTNELTKSTLTLQKNFGLSGKAASEWAGVARARGADTTKLGMAFKTLATQVTAARDGSATSIAMFKKLGLSQQDITKASTDTQFALKAVADGLDRLPPGMDKAAISGKLFGRGWQTIAPVLRDGSDAMQEQLDTVEKYGGVLQGKTLKQQEEFLAVQRESKIAWQGMQVTLGTALTPALIDVNQQFQKIARIMASDKLTDDEKFSRVADILERDFSKALDVIVQMIPTIASRVGEQAPKIAAGLVKGFLDANVWGKLLIGTWLISKFGGWGAISGLGTKIGSRIGVGMGAGLAGSLGSFAVAGAAAAATGVYIEKKWHPVGHLFTKEIPDAFKVMALNSRHVAQTTKKDLMVISTAAEDEFGAAGKAINGLKRQYGSFLTAGHQMSRGQRQAWIDVGQTARKNGDITAKELRQLTDAMTNNRQQWEKSMENISKATGESTRFVKHSIGDMSAHASKDYHHMVVLGTGDTKTLTSKIHQGTKSIVNDNEDQRHTFQQSADTVRNTTSKMGGNVTGLAKAVSKGEQNIGDNTNQVLGSLGAKKLKFSIKDIGNIQPFQRGDVVPGTGNGDKVPAMLEPGEFVVNKKAASKHRGLLEKLNFSDAPRFAEGGFAGMKPGIVSLAKKMLSSFGGYMSSGLRAGDTGSLHSQGLAADIVPDNWGGATRYANQIGSQLLEGIHQGPPGSNVSWDTGQQVPPSFWGSETWAEHISHIHLAVSDAVKGVPGAAKKLKRLLLEGPPGPLKDIGQGALDTVTKAANTYIGKHSGSMLSPDTATGPALKGGRTVAASWFDSGDGSIRGGSGMPYGDTGFAELGWSGGSETAATGLGGLPYGAKVQIGFKGHSAIGKKVDVGSGGPGLGGFPRGIDIGSGLARNLGMPVPFGLELVQVKGAQKGGFVDLFGKGMAHLQAGGALRDKHDGDHHHRHGHHGGHHGGHHRGGHGGGHHDGGHHGGGHHGGGGGGGIPPGTIHPGKKHRKRLKKYLKKIKGEGLPPRVARRIRELQDDVARYLEYADRADLLNREDDDGTMHWAQVYGLNEVGWLQAALEGVENKPGGLRQLRNTLLAGSDIIEKMKRKLERQLKDAEDKLKDKKKALKETDKRLRDNEKKQKHKNKEIDDVHEKIADHRKKHPHKPVPDHLRKRLARLLDDQKHLGNEHSRLSDRKKLLSYEVSTLSNKVIPTIKGQTERDKGKGQDLADSLQEVQGYVKDPLAHKRLSAFNRPYDFRFGGSILDVFTRLRDLNAPGPTPGTDDSQLIEALSEKLLRTQQRLLVSQLQYPVFSQFFANLPQFATGGVVQAPTGAPVQAVVHGGEGVFTRDQMAAMGSGGDVQVLVHGDIHTDRTLNDAIEVRVDGVLRRNVTKARLR